MAPEHFHERVDDFTLSSTQILDLPQKSTWSKKQVYIACCYCALFKTSFVGWNNPELEQWGAKCKLEEVTSTDSLFSGPPFVCLWTFMDQSLLVCQLLWTNLCLFVNFSGPTFVCLLAFTDRPLFVSELLWTNLCLFFSFYGPTFVCLWTFKDQPLFVCELLWTNLCLFVSFYGPTLPFCEQRVEKLLSVRRMFNPLYRPLPCHSCETEFKTCPF